MESGLSSKSCIRYRTNSSLCFSVPMIGENSDSTSTLIIWMEGATAFSLTPNLAPWRMISGSSRLISLRDGAATPYPVCLTILNASAT
ncbi:hypothetical protein SRABI80_04554 [Peribacillus frigoritolerans]|nr:hypothetical protein SRABI80_04554 [Peribacillus frigoritolerans]